jgi:hypothetical protein
VLRRRRLRCRASVVVRRGNGSVTTIKTKLTLLAPVGSSK